MIFYLIDIGLKCQSQENHIDIKKKKLWSLTEIVNKRTVRKMFKNQVL